MPTFDTSAPISVPVDIGAGSAEIIASDRADTVMEARTSFGDIRVWRAGRAEVAESPLTTSAANHG